MDRLRIQDATLWLIILLATGSAITSMVIGAKTDNFAVFFGGVVISVAVLLACCLIIIGRVYHP
jgi:hypothetical protein